MPAIEETWFTLEISSPRGDGWSHVSDHGTEAEAARAARHAVAAVEPPALPSFRDRATTGPIKI